VSDDVVRGRARRLFSLGTLSTSVGGSYLWELVRRPFRSTSDAETSLLEAHIRNAQRLVEGSTELRGAFTKLVQMLSMRQDILPQEALDVLAAVRSSVPPMPFARVRTVLEDELGGAVEARFAAFDPVAVAAASLGQVHRATLPDGTLVAVKVQYPGIDRSVRQDVQNLKALIRIMTGIARDVLRQDVDTREVARELEARLQEELDYRREAANLDRFRALFADDAEVVVPHVHADYTTARVLTMDWMDGYPIEQIMGPGIDASLKDWAAMKFFRLFFRQLLEFGEMQTDPHPGNYLLTHHPHLVMLDFGSVCVLEPDVRRGYVRLARALAANDDGEIGAAGLALGFVRRDPTTFVRLMRLAAEPLMCDALFDPRDYDVVARATEALQIKLGSEPVQAPGHHVFISRALIGMDGYLRAFGTVRNWHRLFREILDDLPADSGSVDEGVAGLRESGGGEEPPG